MAGKDHISMSLTTRFTINARINQTDADDMGTHIISETLGLTLTDGDGANEADGLWVDNRTLADAATEELDFYDGTLTDAFGNSLVFATLKMIYVRNNSTDANLEIGGAASGALLLFDNTSDILALRPGGEFFMSAPNVTGIVTIGSPHLKMTHSGAGTSALDYDIIVAGVLV